MNDETIVVTGISGFIAKHCAVDLLKQGYRVRGTVRDLSKADAVRRTLAQHADVAKLDFAAADLTADAGWDEAVNGAYGVLHVASPFPLVQPKNADEVVRPAVDGTMRVMGAAKRAGVRRFVQTSSSVAVIYGHGPERKGEFTEADWTNPDAPHVTPYQKSKTLAERAARAFVANENPPFHFSSVNPGFVLGPLLDDDAGTSGQAIALFLKGKYPGCPRLAFPVVDVRDIAKAHRLALETAEPSGGRYIAVSETAWFLDMMLAIRAELGQRARKVPTRNIPDWLFKVIAMFDGGARTVLPDLGSYPVIDNSRTRKALGMDFIPLAQSAPAMAESLLRHGLA